MVGPLASTWLDWTAARRQSPPRDEVGRTLAVWSVWALLAGGALGGVLLAIRYHFDESYFRALAVVPRDRLWFAGVEIIFSLALLILYAGFWNRWRRARFAHRLVAAAAATNLLAHFPALFVIISVIAARRPIPTEPLDRAGYQGLLFSPEVVSRVFHLWLAAGATTGIVIALLALRRRPREADEQVAGEYQRTAKSGAQLTLAMTMLQFPVGMWVAFVMPAAQRELLLGGDAVGSLLFLSSLLLAMGLLHVLAPLMQDTAETRHAVRGALVLAVLFLLMVGTRIRAAAGPVIVPAASARSAGHLHAGPVPFQ